MKTAGIWVNTNAEVGNVDHLQVLTSTEAAQRWSEDNEPEGLASLSRPRTDGTDRA